ncbi:MAG: hypothetical protein AB8B99_20845 [Phormidesmis sp.]
MTKQLSTQYLLVKGTAGLGNRLLALVTALLYARLSDRTVSVDWRDAEYSSDGENVFFDLFDLVDIPHTREIPTEGSVYPLLWKSALHRSIESVLADDHALVGVMGQSVFKKYAYDVETLDYDEDILIATGYTDEIDRMRGLLQAQLQPEWNGELNFETASKGDIFEQVYHRHLRLAPAVQQRFEAFRAEHFADKKVIGIHIRMSDKSISYPWYKQALADYVAHCPDACIFLATDNRDVEAELNELYPNVVTLEKWLPEAGVKVHGNTDCPDLKEHAITALLDVALLASCDYLIYSRTTSFGLIASFMTQIPLENQFDIQIYYDQMRKGLKYKVLEFNNKVKHKWRYWVSLLKLKEII